MVEPRVEYLKQSLLGPSLAFERFKLWIFHRAHSAVDNESRKVRTHVEICDCNISTPCKSWEIVEVVDK